MTEATDLMLPDPKPRETVFSLLARSHLQSGIQNPLTTLLDVTSRRGYQPLSGLPTHLERIVDQLPTPMPLSKFISDHTLFNLFRVFVPFERRQYIMDAMITSGASKSRLGLLKSHCGASDQLAYCPACCDSDHYCHGFAYWHCEHTVTGVSVCPYHNICLETVDIRHDKYGVRGLCLPPYAKVWLRKSSLVEKSQFIAQQVVALLNEQCDDYYGRPVYQQVLREHGLTTEHGHIRIAPLSAMVRSWLEDLKCLSPFDRLYEALDIERNWVANIVAGRPGLHHPLKHIILWATLEIDQKILRCIHSGSHEQMSIAFKRNDPPQVDESAIIKTFKKQGSALRTAAINGCSVNTVLAVLDRNRIPRQRKPKYVSIAVMESVREMAKAGMSTRTISDKLKISVTTVNRIKRVPSD